MTRTGENRQHIGHDRSEVVDVLRVAAQDAFSDLNQIVQAAGELHRRNSGDHRCDDQNHVPRNVARLHTENQTKYENAGAAGITDADAAQANTEEDRAQKDDDLENEHDIHNASRHG